MERRERRERQRLKEAGGEEWETGSLLIVGKLVLVVLVHPKTREVEATQGSPGGRSCPPGAQLGQGAASRR